MDEPPHKKRKTNAFSFDVNDFADEYADSGGEEDDIDSVDDDINPDDFARHQREVEQRYRRREEATLNSDITNRNAQFEARENILDRLQKKYAPQNNYIAQDDDIHSLAAPSNRATHAPSAYDTHSVHESQHNQTSHIAPISVEATLPSVQDPNLWLVPCLPGKERYAVQELLKKYFKYLNHPTKKLFIKTAFTTDMNTGYIYVEAFKEIHVRRAAEDISGLNTWKLRLVPRNEMVDALTIKGSGPQIKRGQWCRFQRGLYKGDLAQVYAIMDQGSRVVLRVVPRIDYGKLSIMNSNNANGQNGQRGQSGFIRKGRPAQKLFNKSEIELYEDGHRMPEVVGQDSILKTRVIRWRGKKYKNGCQLVNMPVNQVEFDVTAAPEEVQLLRSKTGDDDYDDDGDEELDEVAPPIFSKTCEFVRGDTVKVIKGAMTNLIGEVLTTQPNPVSGKITVTVLPEHKDLHEAIMFPSDELQKHFKVGCHVKVKRGKFKDETGLIIKVDDSDKKEVIIFSDLTSRTIRVDINDITETSEVSTGRDVLGNYALYELVHLSRDVVGVIVSIQNGTFKILDNKDQIQDCRLPDIARHSRDEHAVALDIDNNQIRIGDVIMPQVGDFKQQRATVKHVYRSVLFCHTKSCTVNSGIFVCRSRLCRLAGGRINRTNNNSSINRSTDTKNDRRLRILHKHRSSRDPWMHKTVKVKRGNYKGNIGIVCGCTDQKLNIELHAKCKKIQIKREWVKVINKDGTDIDDNPYSNMASSMSNRNGSDNRRNNNGGFGHYNNGNSHSQPQRQRRRDHAPYAHTPLVGVQTPAHSGYGNGADTPGFGSQTPAMGGQTPGYGGVTPAHSGYGNDRSSAWNVGAATPAMMGAQTPLSPAYDPNHNSHSTYSHNSHQAATPSYGGNGYMNQQNGQNDDDDDVNGHMSTSNGSESEQGDSYERAMAQDPYYYVVANALLSYNGEEVVIKEVNKMNNVCSLRYMHRDESVDNVPLSNIQHSVFSDSNAKCKVVWGKLRGEIGSLIGIDNEEAVVQLSATTEVTIIPKKLVVVYVEP